MSLKLSEILNPTPLSDALSSTQVAMDGGDPMDLDQVPSHPTPSGVEAGADHLPPSSTQPTTAMHLDMENRRSEEAATSLPAMDSTVDQQRMPSIPPLDEGVTNHQRRQSLQLPPLEPSPILEQHSSSPTLHQYHHGSSSPERRRQSDSDRQSSPQNTLPPLHVVAGALREHLNTHQNLPLFRPPQPQPKHDRKPSASNPTRTVSHSPAPSTEANMPISQAVLDSIEDPADREAILAATRDLGLRTSRQPSNKLPTTQPGPPAPPTTAAPKKRAAAKVTAANKKGISKKQTNPKKRKAEAKPPPKKRSSTAPPVDDGEPDIEGEEDDENDGDEDATLYCYCQKPDDHKYMIGCDGCDNWFHGACVNITEDKGKQIGQFFCRDCEAAEKGKTTWKLLCRRIPCPNPCEMDENGKFMNYCSKQCGVRFFKDLIARADAQHKAAQKSQHLQHTGALSASQIKSLVEGVSTAAEFRALGNAPPLAEARNATNMTYRGAKAGIKDKTKDKADDSIKLLPEEETMIRDFAKQKEDMRAKRAIIKAREKLVDMAKTRLQALCAREGIATKAVCGFEMLLLLSNEELGTWLDTPEGTALFDAGELPVPAYVGEQQEEPEDGVKEVFMCQRKGTCGRHKTWVKLAVDENRQNEGELKNKWTDVEMKERAVFEGAKKRGGA